MAVTYGDYHWVTATSVLVAWSSNLSEPTFYVYRDGELVTTTQQTSMLFTVATGDKLVLEVLDDADALPSTAFPGRLTLQWAATAATDHYRVEEYVGGQWTERQSIADDGSQYYAWQSRYLEDETTHQFRIVPVGTNGNDGAATSFSCLMVRHPDAPTPTWSYNSGTKKATITIP